MSIIINITPKGLHLESAANNDSNFQWSSYLEISPMVVKNDTDQLLVHSELESTWANWLLDFDLVTAGTIDQAADELIQQTAFAWSADSGMSGELDVSKEIESVVAEKLSLLPNNEFVSVSIVP
jgi:hypothetical protein